MGFHYILNPPRNNVYLQRCDIYGLTSQMLHSIKSQGNWPFGSREEDFEEFFTI